MKKLSLLNVWKWVLVLFQVLFIVVAVAFAFMSYQTKTDGTDLLTTNISNLSLIPEDEEILQKSEMVTFNFRSEDEIQPKILVDKTSIQFEHGLSSFRTGLLIIVFLICGAAFFALEQLKVMIKTVQNGNPFVKSNVWRIYILSTLFFLVPLFAKLTYFLQDQWVKEHFEFTGLIFEGHDVNYFPWLTGGVLLLTIGKIMEQGIKLYEEQKLTV